MLNGITRKLDAKRLNFIEDGRTFIASWMNLDLTGDWSR